MRILPSQLADALGRDELSEATKAAWFTLGLLVPPVLAPGAIRNADGGALYFIAAGLVITIGGVVLCHRANASGDGRNLVERMACLSPPLWIAVYAAYSVATVVYSKFAPPPLPPPETAEDFRAWASATARSTSFYSLAFIACYVGFTGALVHFVRRAAVAGLGRRPAERRPATDRSLGRGIARS